VKSCEQLSVEPTTRFAPTHPTTPTWDFGTKTIPDGPEKAKFGFVIEFWSRTRPESTTLALEGEKL